MQSKAQKHTCLLQTCDLRPGAAESYISQSLGSGAHGGTQTASRSPQTPRWEICVTCKHVQKGESITLVLRPRQIYALGTWANHWKDSYGCHDLRGLLLALSGWNPGMLLNTPPCPGHTPQSVNQTEAAPTYSQRCPGPNRLTFHRCFDGVAGLEFGQQGEAGFEREAWLRASGQVGGPWRPEDEQAPQDGQGPADQARNQDAILDTSLYPQDRPITGLADCLSPSHHHLGHTVFFLAGSPQPLTTATLFHAILPSAAKRSLHNTNLPATGLFQGSHYFYDGDQIPHHRLLWPTSPASLAHH